MKGWIVYNPRAGRFDPRFFVERAARRLSAAGWELSLFPSHGLEDMRRLAAECGARGCTALFVAGGDGSVGHAARGLAGSDTALAVLPAGTANVFAQDAGLPGLSYTRWFALEDSARRLAAGRAARVDVGRCNGEVFLLWAGAGLDGYIISRIEPRTRLQKLFASPHYIAAAFLVARRWHGVELRVGVDSQELSGIFAQVLASNIQSYGGGLMPLDRGARLDDGLLNVWLFEGETYGDALRLVGDLFRGRHAHNPHVRGLTARKLWLEAARPIPSQLDGEVFPPARRFEIEVWPGALKLLLPAELPRPLLVETGAPPEETL